MNKIDTVLTDEEIVASDEYKITRDKGCFHAGAFWARQTILSKLSAKTEAQPVVKNRYELTRSIIHNCPAIKLPRSFAMKIGMMAQIVPLPGFTQEKAEEFLADLNHTAPLPQQESKPDRAFLERTLAAMEGVIDVADRKTDEFEELRACVIELTLMLYKRPQQLSPATKQESQLLVAAEKALVAFDALVFNKFYDGKFSDALIGLRAAIAASKGSA